jgi:hypothetical protein
MRTRLSHRFGLALAAAVGCAVIAPALPAAAASSARHNLVVNGGFEQVSGTTPLHWTTQGGANAFSGASHSGTYHMDMVVGTPLPNVASVSQKETIPASIGHATLRFWTEDFSCGDKIRFDAHVIAGGHDTIVKTIPGKTCGAGYVMSSVSVLQFKGQTVTLRLSTTFVSGSSGGPLFYLDDVSLLVG